MIEADRNTDVRRRKEYSGAIRTVCDVLGRPAEAVPSSMPEIHRLLQAVPPAVHGRSRKTIDNARSRIKAALGHYLGGGNVPPRGYALDPAWAVLHAALSDARLRNGLSRLIRFASYWGVAPENMNDEVLERIITAVGQVNWGRDARPFHRKAATLWKEAAQTIPGWPQARLTSPSPPARPSHLPLAAFPVSFQRDVAAYLKWAAGADPFASDAPPLPLKPSTLRLRGNQLRIAASMLAQQRGGPDAVRDLATLVEPAHVKVILTALLETTSDRRPTSFIRGLGMVLRAVAQHWVKSTSADLDELTRIQRKLGSDRTGLTDKNRALVRQFEDQRLLAQLLALPDALRKRVSTRRLSPSRRLQQVRIALAIDLLLVAPIRLHNLANLRIDRNLQWPSGRDGTVYLVLDESETKNAQPLEYPLPERTRDILRDYLDRYVPLVDARAKPWLFVQLDGSPVTSQTLRDGITKSIKRELGVAMTPHQFRHLAASIALDHQPGALGLVKDLLGHKSLKTTANFYAGMRTRQAGRAYDRILATRRDPDLGTS
jgi:integrase